MDAGGSIDQIDMQSRIRMRDVLSFRRCDMPCLVFLTLLNLDEDLFLEEKNGLVVGNVFIEK